MHIRIDQKPRKLYPLHEDAVRTAMELNKGDPDLLYVATHGPEGGRCSHIEVFEADEDGAFVVPVGYW